MARILIVDDEEDIREILKGALARMGGHVCDLAGSAKEGLAFVAGALAKDGEEYDLILSDIRMPGMDGFDFLHTIMGQVEAMTPCIVITGSGEDDTAIRAVQERAFDFVRKPWETPDLKRAVERGLERRGELKRLRTQQRQLEQRLSDAELQLKRYHEATVSGFVSLLEERDPVLADRAGRARALCGRIGRALGLEGKDLEAVEVGAMLHDIGMCMIPNAILRKQGELDERDREVMRIHPTIGADLCAHIASLKSAADVVRHHHERWDGGGYPAGISGEAIPLGARIVAVVDAYDAITSKSAYQAPKSPTDGLAEVRRCAGWQFDPRVVDAFEKTLREFVAEPAKGPATPKV